MKIALQTLSALLLLNHGCSSGTSQSTSTSADGTAVVGDTTGGTDDTATPGAPDSPGPVMAGGWSEGDVNAAGPREAAAFAVLTQSQQSGDTVHLVSIAWVAQQVVSGMNYRLGLNITRNGVAEQATAQVYSQPWTSTTQLTSWTSGLVR